MTIDMSPAYVRTVERYVPKAALVFDRFHGQRLVQDALDATRRDEVRAAIGEEAKNALKTRWALQKSPWNLTDADIATLNELEQTNRVIFRGHLQKDAFAGILDGQSLPAARKRLRRWVAEAQATGLEHFQRAARTIGKHAQRILAYVKTGFSNGRTEGLNGKIRTITRRSNGFHSAAALISMVFLCCGGVHVTPAFSKPEGFHSTWRRARYFFRPAADR